MSQPFPSEVRVGVTGIGKMGCSSLASRATLKQGHMIAPKYSNWIGADMPTASERPTSLATHQPITNGRGFADHTASVNTPTMSYAEGTYKCIYLKTVSSTFFTQPQCLWTYVNLICIDIEF